MEETGCVGEWRSATGNDPINQARVKLVVDEDLENVLSFINNSITNDNKKLIGKNMFILDENKEKGWRKVYRAIKIPFSLHVRDLLYDEHTVRRNSRKALVCSRSCEEQVGVRESNAKGRIRATLNLGCYVLERNFEDESKTDITALFDFDLHVVAATDFLHRKVAVGHLKGIVDEYSQLGKADNNSNEKKYNNNNNDTKSKPKGILGLFKKSSGQFSKKTQKNPQLLTL